MAKYRFESLLKIREAESQEKKNALLETQSQLQSTRERLENCLQKITQSQEETRLLYLKNQVTPQELRQQRKFHETLVAQHQAILLEIETLETILEKRRIELQNVVKEVKTLEMLKEKKERRLLEEDKRRTNKELDDLAIQQKTLESHKSDQDRLD